jgi:hypothetical protein
MEQMMERLLAKIDARMDASTKALQEKANAKLKELIEDIKTNRAKTDINLKESREQIQSGHAEMRSIVNACIVDMKNG